MSGEEPTTTEDYAVFLEEVASDIPNEETPDGITIREASERLRALDREKEELRRRHNPEVCVDVQEYADRLEAENTRLRDRVAELEHVQSEAREAIYQVLSDEDLDEERMRRWFEGVLPRIHDSLHVSQGFAASECFTEDPQLRFLNERLERENAQLRADSERLEWLEKQIASPIHNNGQEWLANGRREVSWESRWNSAERLRDAIDAARHREAQAQGGGEESDV